MQPAREGLLAEGFCISYGDMLSIFGEKLKPLLYDGLTVTYAPKIGPVKKVALFQYVRVGGILYVILPRANLSVMMRRNIINSVKICFAPIRRISATLAMPLFPNQELVVDHLVSTIFTPERQLAGTSAALLNFRAGQGKTFVAAAIAARLGLRCLYIVLQRQLMYQAYDDFKNALEGCVIGIFGRTKKCQPADHDITLIVIDSAMNQPREFFQEYSLIIYDEVHAYCSDKRRMIFRKSMTHVNFGMSATTEDRDDGFDVISHKELALDGIIRAESLPGYNTENEKFDLTVTVVHYKGPAEYTVSLSHPSTGKLFIPYMNDQFISDPYRLEMVVGIIRDLYNWRDGDRMHSIYVFCENRAPLGRLHQLLRKDFAVDAPELEISEFMGGVNAADVKLMREKSRILLATYGYSGTGTSITRMTAAVFLTSRKKKMKQIVGRILRSGSDAGIPRHIVDIIDESTPVRQQFASRLPAYELYNAKMRHKHVVAN
jgi:superfamily II DNA or RNA helicase